MTEAELEAEISLVSTAISNILKTGSRYEVETGSSKRVFEAIDIDQLRNYRADLNRQLRDIQGTSGFVGGF